MDQPGKQTILVVEDQAALLELAKSMLEMEDYNVLGAESGVRALAVANGFKGEIHLLLTDIMMPGMKGDELYRLLREQRPELKVLYMTGHTEDSLAERGLSDSGGEYIQKPFRQRVLLARVAEALGARQS